MKHRPPPPFSLLRRMSKNQAFLQHRYLLFFLVSLWLLANSLGFAQTTIINNVYIPNISSASYLSGGNPETTSSNSVVTVWQETIVINPNPPTTSAKLAKTASPASGTAVAPESNLSYTLTYASEGTVDPSNTITRNNVVLTDVLDANFNLTNVVVSVNGTEISSDLTPFNAATRTVTVTRSSLLLQDVLTVTLQGTVAAGSAGQTLKNQGQVSWTNPDGTTQTTTSDIVSHPIEEKDTTTPITGNLVKQATPPTGSSIVVTDKLDYHLIYVPVLDQNSIPKDNKVSHRNLVLTDVLNPLFRLENVVVQVDGNIISSDLTPYDPITHTVTVKLDELLLQSKLTVTLQGRTTPNAKGQTLENQANITWESPNGTPDTTDSNIVAHPVVDVPVITPIDPDSPINNCSSSLQGGGQATSRLGQEVTFAYILKNPTKDLYSYTLSTQANNNSQLAKGYLRPSDMVLYVDVNGNGVFDDGDVPASTVTLKPESDLALLLVVSLPPEDIVPDSSSTQSFVVDVIGACQNGKSSQTSSVIVIDPNAPINPPTNPRAPKLVKAVVPANNTAVEVGSTISYTLTFNAGNKDRENVVISDVLNEFLSNVQVSASATDAVINYDEGANSVQVSFATVAANSQVSVTIQATVSDNAQDGDVIKNQATSAWEGGSTPSNPVQNPVIVPIPLCSLNIAPDGIIGTPAHDMTALPGETVVLPYTLTNTSNAPFDFDLTTLLVRSDIEGLTIKLQGDDNADIGNIIELQPNESRDVLISITLPDDPSIAGDIFVNLSGTCGLATDQDNISKITVPEGGIFNLRKSAVPASGSTVARGQDISYTLSFTTQGRKVDNITLSDTLHPFLNEPSSITLFINNATQQGFADYNYDASSHTLTVNLTDLAANTSVQVVINTTVRQDDDVVDGSRLPNVWCLTGLNGTVPVEETCSNEVEHIIDALELLINKEADRARVNIGETLRYTITITNPSARVALESLELTDVLPAGLEYLPGTATVTLPNDTTNALADPANFAEDGLKWMLPALAPGQSHEVSFDTRVLPLAAESENLKNTAVVTAPNKKGEAVASRTDDAVVIIDNAFFRGKPVLVGMAYIDNDDNGVFGRGDEPVSGLRLYLPDGVSTVTDEYGQYAFLDINSRLTTLKLDRDTLPNRAIKPDYNQERLGFWRLRLFEGTMTRQDVVFEGDDSRIEFNETITIKRGTVDVVKQVTRQAYLDEDTGEPVPNKRMVTVTLTVKHKGAVTKSALNLTDSLPQDIDMIDVTTPENVTHLEQDDTITFTSDRLEPNSAITTSYQYIEPDRRLDVVPPSVTWRLP